MLMAMSDAVGVCTSHTRNLNRQASLVGVVITYPGELRYIHPVNA